jgi:hypothetical protein
MAELDIVELIEKNPITKLSQTYNSKLLTKIKNTFSNFEQQIFVSSFYCYLNYNKTTDFVIDLDNVWKWVGFAHKAKAKCLLEKYFILDKDYTQSLTHQGKRTNDEQCSRGGQNKEIFMLTVKTFKSFCLKAGTKKADEIHEYYLKLEDIIYEVIDEESNELKLQLESKQTEINQQKEQLVNHVIQIENHLIQTEKEKDILLEKTLISQFPINTQCIYYGKIDNKTLGKPNSKMYQETVIKFGQTNDLGRRVSEHKKNFTNFRLVAAFNVKNKIQIENAIKQNKILEKRMRTIMINDICCRELLALDGVNFTIEKIDEYIRDIIKLHEYNIENYNLLVESNYKLEDDLRKSQNEIIEKNEQIEKMNKELENFKGDITSYTKNKITSIYNYCKSGYVLYVFECEYMRYKCSLIRNKDIEQLTETLKQQDVAGEMKYKVSVSYPFSEKIMIFLLKQSTVLIGTNKFEGSFADIKQILDITAKLETILIDNSKDLTKLSTLLDNGILNQQIFNVVVNNDPETPIVRKAKRSIDQISIETGDVIQTFDSIEAAGRIIGRTGSAVGIALREKRACNGFLWRYSGISKEDQYAPQPVIKVCCSTGENTKFKNIADAARDSNISAPGLRSRILTNVHINGYHWIFDKTSTHYK